MPTEHKTVPGNLAGPPAKAADSRQERLAQALRDNLKKRKAQQRERKEGQRERKEGQRERQEEERERQEGERERPEGRQDGQGGGAEPCAPAGSGDGSTR